MHYRKAKEALIEEATSDEGRASGLEDLQLGRSRNAMAITAPDIASGRRTLLGAGRAHPAVALSWKPSVGLAFRRKANPYNLSRLLAFNWKAAYLTRQAKRIK